MSYDSLVNHGDYVSAHYLAEVLPKDLKDTVRDWTERESAQRERARAKGRTAAPATPRAGLRRLRSQYADVRLALAEHTEQLGERAGRVTRDRAAAHTERLHTLHRQVLTALGYQPKPEPADLVVERGERQIPVRVALHEPTLAAIECGWAPDTDAALDPHGAGALIDPVELPGSEPIQSGAKLATWLLTEDEHLRYVLILAGGVVILADRATWGEGRYLAVSLDVALERNDTDELGTIAALFGAEALLPPEEGGTEPLATLLENSRNHAVGVSTELRAGLQRSVEIIAGEVLERLREQGVRPEQVAETGNADDFAQDLAHESLRYLYRILFLLYAEARPELGVVPANDEAYTAGYSMARLGDLVVRDLVGEEARRSTHLYDSLDVLFRMVNTGHGDDGHVPTEKEAAQLSEGEGLRFEAMKADLFHPERIRLIGRRVPHPDTDPDLPTAFLDTRLRNQALYQVLRLLMLAPGNRKKGRGGFISYAQLGINQLGAVYEGLMSYTGFIAAEELYEAATNRDPSNGSWLVPHSRVSDYPDSVWVMARDEDGKPTEERVVYRPGTFVYRLAGRDRETSASYYTPESLTSLTVQLTLRERLDQHGETTPARELLGWTICEPALGSGAFLNEVINQVAMEYLKRRQVELDQRLDPETYATELKRVKAYLALHRCYGVDLNETAVELAEISLWLNVMHRGLQAPWFGLHLVRGNSLVGATRRSYPPELLHKAAWLRETPQDMDSSPQEVKDALGVATRARERLDAAVTGVRKLVTKRDRDAAAATNDHKRSLIERSGADLRQLDAALTRASGAMADYRAAAVELRRIAVLKGTHTSTDLANIVRLLHEAYTSVITALPEVLTAVDEVNERPTELAGVPEALREVAAAAFALSEVDWLDAEPYDWPTTVAEFPAGHVHQFLLPATGWGVAANEKEAKNLVPQQASQLANWRKAMRRAPSTKKPKKSKKSSGKGKPDRSQVQRLHELAGRAEFLWNLVGKRLEVSEREISRRIDVWGAEDLDQPLEAVSRDKVLDDLTRVGTPYWRLKTLMDTWCALWFWPVRQVGLLDGTDDIYQRLATPVTLDPMPGNQALFSAGDVVGGQGDLLTDAGAATTNTQVRPLTDLDAWLDFAEALLGSRDIEEGSLLHELDSLAELDEREEQLPGQMGMVTETVLDTRFPWLHEAQRVAEQHGFFHWELRFAQVFARGGFDIQVGNPPWVRPDWDQDAVLAEFDPWFKLVPKVAEEQKQDRKAVLLEDQQVRDVFLGELSDTAGMSEYLADVSTYPLIAGTRPDLYRGFMCRVWGSLGEQGTAGLIHPDTHFGDAKAGRLRAEAYRRLRVHAHFTNQRILFHEVADNTQFGVHVYGNQGSIVFTNVSWLYDPSVLVATLDGIESTEIPGIKHNKTWDLRPHRTRLIPVDGAVLSEWQRLTGDFDGQIEYASLLSPVSTAEAGAIAVLAEYPRRLGAEEPYISSGYNEKTAKTNSIIHLETHQPESLGEVILQGPHLGVATPNSKEPPNFGSSDKPRDLTLLPSNAVPAANYNRATDLETYQAAQDVWGTYRYTEYFRLAWRRMIAFNGERSLFAALIPPGPAHVHLVHTLACSDNRRTVLNAGFWAALPLDYLLRITGRGHLQHGEAAAMPHGSPSHPLASSLLLRTLRLNCLTNAYAPLWAELYDPACKRETWAVEWPGLAALGNVGAEWEYATPLRTERERRSALVELDALVAVWLGMTADQLVAVYKSRYPVLFDREAESWFDAAGRKIAASHHTFGHGQTKEHYQQLRKHLESPDTEPAPEDYTPPFHKADREAEYRQAHAVFLTRQEHARESGEWDGTP